MTALQSIGDDLVRTLQRALIAKDLSPILRQRAQLRAQELGLEDVSVIPADDRDLELIGHSNATDETVR